MYLYAIMLLCFYYFMHGHSKSQSITRISVVRQDFHSLIETIIVAIDVLIEVSLYISYNIRNISKRIIHI